MLVFFTGTNQVPPIGFEKVSTVSFLHHDAMFATASTCDVKLRLPIKYGDDIERFKQAMIMSLCWYVYRQIDIPFTQMAIPDVL